MFVQHAVSYPVAKDPFVNLVIFEAELYLQRRKFQEGTRAVTEALTD